MPCTLLPPQAGPLGASAPEPAPLPYGGAAQGYPLFDAWAESAKHLEGKKTPPRSKAWHWAVGGVCSKDGTARPLRYPCSYSSSPGENDPALQQLRELQMLHLDQQSAAS